MNTLFTKLYHLYLILIHRIFFKSLLRIFVGIQFSSNESLRKTPQYIYLSNHNSHLDTPSLTASLPCNKLISTHPVAAFDYFGKSFLGRFLVWTFNARFIYREKRTDGPNTIEIMERILNEQKSIIIFPEGTRGNPGEMSDLKPGVAILLKKYPHIPFIPAYLSGVEKALPRGEKFIVPYNGSLVIGQPCFIDKSMNIPEILAFIKTKIEELNPQGRINA